MERLQAMAKMPHTSNKSRRHDYPFFRKTWNKVVVALLAVSFVPMILIGGGLYYYASSVLKEQTLNTLRREVLSQKRIVDGFFTERVLDLQQLADTMGRKALTRPGVLGTVFKSLHQKLSCFVDLGIIDGQGRHLAYAGPFDLLSKNYQKAQWFRQAMAGDVYISDVFMGFRQKPHFIIAVKKMSNEGAWIIRATVDSNYFNSIVAQIPGNHKGDAYLVNRKGIYQTQSNSGGKLMASSNLSNLAYFDGVRMEAYDGVILMKIWQEKVPWLNVVQMEQADIYAILHRVRYLAVYVFILSGIIILGTVLLTTNFLVSRLESKQRSISMLDKQLRRASYLSSSMELCLGFFYELKDNLANIDVTATLLQEQLKEKKTNEIETGMEQIRSQVLRGRAQMDKFVGFIRVSDPIIMEINVADMLDDLLYFMQKELEFTNIQIIRDYDAQVPFVRSDRGKLRQVFQNIVLNAVAAIGKDGVIVLKTRNDHNMVTMTITDNGPGIPPENLEKIFEPLYSSKPEGTGLGLSICRDILTKLGGTIFVTSKVAEETSFVVALPLPIKS
ncbi:MAG: hypothetical protein KAH06_02345 [Desulfobacterales bacterium]|nr:hypothetical protein [Desulfobacterales bacterium]